ncbi:hypothetical protein GOP47_0029630 [Adiantum capillus-veneris]|nr:hypothetical protein GOP47_0029630 [Adiantum capillus-veneris]
MKQRNFHHGLHLRAFRKEYSENRIPKIYSLCNPVRRVAEPKETAVEGRQYCFHKATTRKYTAGHSHCDLWNRNRQVGVIRWQGLNDLGPVQTTPPQRKRTWQAPIGAKVHTSFPAPSMASSYWSKRPSEKISSSALLFSMMHGKQVSIVLQR